MSSSITYVRGEVSGPKPPSPAELRGVAMRRMNAAVRESSEEARRCIRILAAPHRKTGTYSRLLDILPPRITNGQVSGGVDATALHSRALEEGRRGFTIRPIRSKALRIPTGNGGAIFRASARIGPARAFHLVRDGIVLAQPTINRINEKWATAIADDFRGRVRRGV